MTALAFAALAGSAHAAETSGTLTLTVTAKADRALRRTRRHGPPDGQGDAQRAQADAPARAPATRRRCGPSGSLRLRAKRGSVTLGSPRLELGANPRVTAMLGGRRATLLTLAVAPLSSATGVSLQRTSGTLAAGAARTLERRLKVKRLPRASFATVTAVASFQTGAPPPRPRNRPGRPTARAGPPPQAGRPRHRAAASRR